MSQAGQLLAQGLSNFGQGLHNRAVNKKNEFVAKRDALEKNFAQSLEVIKAVREQGQQPPQDLLKMVMGSVETLGRMDQAMGLQGFNRRQQVELALQTPSLDAAAKTKAEREAKASHAGAVQAQTLGTGAIVGANAGAEAAAKANAQTAGTDFAAAGRAEAEQLNAKAAATDNALLGRNAAEQQQAEFGSMAGFIAENTELTREQALQALVGMEEDEKALTRLDLAKAAAGYEDGQPITPEVIDAISVEWKKFGGTEDMFARMLQSLQVGTNAQQQTPKAGEDFSKASVEDLINKSF